MVRKEKGMAKAGSKALAMTMAVALLMMGEATVAGAAVNAPKWVAALYVEAQKMVGLRWAPTPGATGYKILRSTTSGKDYQEIASTAAPQHFDKDLKPGVTYYYVLQAVTAAETSPNSAEKSVVIPGVKEVKETLPPEWSTFVAKQRTQFGKPVHEIHLSWKPVPQVIAYNVYRSTEPGKNYELISSAGETRMIDPKVEEGKTYYYVLTALDKAFKETKYSEEKSVAVVAKKKKAVATKKRVEILYKPTQVLYRVMNEVSVPGGKIPISQCADVVVNESLGRAYFTNYAGRAVMVVDADDGRFLFAIRRQVGPTREKYAIDPRKDFFNPQGLALDGDGNIYVTDKERAEVSVFDEDGAPLRTISIKNELWAGTAKDLHPSGQQPKNPRPVDVAVNSAGDIFVSDFPNTKILVFDSDGRFQFAFGKRGKTTPDEMISPTYLSFDEEDRLSVVDSQLVTVKVFDAEGEFLRGFGRKGQGAGTLFSPTGIIALEGGAVIIASGLTPNVQRFDAKGDFEWVLSDEKGEGSPEAGSIRGIWLDSKNRIYLAMATVNQLGVFQLLEGTIKPTK